MVNRDSSTRRRTKGCEGFDGLGLAEEHRPDGYDDDGDGMPNWWETAVGTDPATADNNGDDDGDGYTNLEDYLNWMACPNFTINEHGTVTIDMKEYFRGYNNKPSFNIGTEGSVRYADKGNGVFDFDRSTGGAMPLAAAEVTATDADNAGQYTRTFNFYLPPTETGISTKHKALEADTL